MSDLPDLRIEDKRLSKRVTLTPVGVEFHRSLTLDEYARLIEVGDAARELGAWTIADAIVHSRQEHGEDAAQILPERYKPGYINNLVWVASNWPLETRVVGVPLSFHQVVTPLMGEALKANNLEAMNVARQWLIDAVELGWQRDELAREFRTYLLPPSLRSEEVAGEVPLDDEPLVLNVTPIYTVVDLKGAASELLAWAQSANAPDHLVRKLESILKYMR